MTYMLKFLLGYAVTREVIRRAPGAAPVLLFAALGYLVTTTVQAGGTVSLAKPRASRRPAGDLRPVVVGRWQGP